MGWPGLTRVNPKKNTADNYSIKWALQKRVNIKSHSQLPKSLAGNLSFMSFYLTEYLKLKLTAMLRISLPRLHRYWFIGCLRHLKHDAKGVEKNNDTRQWSLFVCGQTQGTARRSTTKWRELPQAWDDFYYFASFESLDKS
jgi:hypothetical protein